ncbi:helix-turn-helix domain-containing protein [Paenibacillus sp. RC67]|uniref:ArsR/SmtB family transcription factor n=1 Tax=Paenibacillus sp. RC67 TaxID=3039392 RepID=UPI0024AD0FB6|nr:helix-turn-helix domain-containing protein [Paenibacillus sp. RC67]
MKILFHPAVDDIHLCSVLYALSDPVRMSLVSKVAQHGAQPCSSFELPVAKSTASHHIRTLREAGVVRVQIQGTQHIVDLRKDDLEKRFPGLMDAVLNAVTV